MKRLATFLALLLFSFSIMASAAEKQPAFDYRTQIGVAEVTAKGDTCLTISNAALRENQTIKFVLLDDPQKVIETRIVRKLQSSCSKNTEVSPDSSFYAFAAGKEHSLLAIAVIGFSGDIKVKNGEVKADLNGDGYFESFRSCASSEGLHLTVWAKEPLKSKPLWHSYYYLGYDVEASCSPADYGD